MGVVFHGETLNLSQVHLSRLGAIAACPTHWKSKLKATVCTTIVHAVVQDMLSAATNDQWDIN